MSLRQGHGLPSSEEEMQGYYQTLGPEWTGVDTVCQMTDTDPSLGPYPGLGLGLGPQLPTSKRTR